MTYRIVPCPKCDRMHGVASDGPKPTRSRRGPARPFTGPFVSPLRVQASRSQLDDSAVLGDARDRAESERSDRSRPAVAGATNPMPVTGRRRLFPPSGAGG